jgi:5-formyltetrahydrofolate cyclo-ligase
LQLLHLISHTAANEATVDLWFGHEFQWISCEPDFFRKLRQDSVSCLLYSLAMCYNGHMKNGHETNLREQKKALRNLIESRRSALGDSERRSKSARICRNLQELPLFANASFKACTVFAYMPTRYEADISGFLEWLWQRGCRVLVPKTAPAEGRMSLHEIRGFDDCVAGHWGIREPRDTIPAWEDLAEIDAVLVPGVAFDLAGRRLGYGGGYYDRFFADLEKKLGADGQPVRVAAVFDCQIVSEVPADRHDMAVNLIVTETGCKNVKAE